MNTSGAGEEHLIQNDKNKRMEFGFRLNMMIQTFFNKIFRGKQLLRAGVMLVVLLGGVQSVKGQIICPQPDASDQGMNSRVLPGTSCANQGNLTYEIDVTYLMNYTGCTPGNVEFRIDWGDGEIEDVPYTTVDNLYGPTKFRYKLTHTHIYKPKHTECSFLIRAYLVDNKVVVAGNTDPLNIVAKLYHQTDDYSHAPGKEMVMEDDVYGKTVVLVCVGQETCIKFLDVSQINCNPVEDVDIQRNTDPRHIQFEYGTSTVPGNAPGNTIPFISVDGVLYTDANGAIIGNTRFDGGEGTTDGSFTTVNIVPRQETTGVKTSEICVSGNTTMADVGKEFRVKLYNWNKCNPLSGAAPTDADRNDYWTPTTEAIIRIVASPPKPDDQEKVFCYRKTDNTKFYSYDNDDYTTTLVHRNLNGMTGGTYYWFMDDGTTQGPISTDPADAIHTSTSLTGFNPVTLFAATHPAYLNQSPSNGNGLSKIYWVIYEFTNKQDDYNVLCASQPAKITYTIREDITAEPKTPTSSTGKMTACPDDIITFTISTSDPLDKPIGGDITYVWEAGDYCEIVPAPIPPVTTATGTSVSIRFKNDQAAPIVNTAKVRLYRRWKDQVSTSPDCSGTDCRFCPSLVHEFEVEVNPKPTARITGGGEICADEQLSLKIDRITGTSASTTFNIELTPDGILNNHPGTNDATISVNPPAGTVTTYTIASLKDNQSGCINTGIVSSATITKRVDLSLNGPIDGPDPVCEGTTNTYVLTNDPATGNVNPGGATRYVWTYNGSSIYTGTDNNRQINAGTLPPGSTSAVTREIKVTREYTTQTATTKNRCPASETKSIIVRPKPTGKVVTPNDTRCLGEDASINIELTGLPNVDWVIKWKVGSSAEKTETVSSTTTGKRIYSVDVEAFTYLPAAGLYTFTLTAVSQQSGGACAGSPVTPVTAQIKVLKQPKASISGVYNMCENETSVEIPITLTGENTGTYRVTYDVGTRLGETMNFTVPLNSPKLIIPNTPAFINQTNLAATTVTIKSVEEQTKALDGTDKPCFDDSETTFDIIYHKFPTVADAGIGREDCEKTSAPPFTYDLKANDPNSYSGKWRIISSPCGGSFSDDTDHEAKFTAPCNGRYELEWEISGPGYCPPSTDRVILEWGKDPNDPIAGTGGSWCYDLDNPRGFPLGANAPDLTIESGRWSVKAGSPSMTVTFANPTSNQTTVTVPVYGEYTFIWELYNECGSKTSEVKVNFIQTPKIDPAIPTQYWCPETPNTLVPNFSSDVLTATYAWELVGSSLPSMSNFPSSGTGAFPTAQTPANNTSQNVQYKSVRVIATNQTCPSSPVTIDIYLKPRPVLKPVTPTSMCSGATLTFDLDPYLGQPVKYDWDAPDGGNIGLPVSGNVTPPAGGVGNITTFPYAYEKTVTNTTDDPVTVEIKDITATVNGCTSLPMTVALTVNPIPVMTLPDPQICSEDMVQANQTDVTSNVDNTTYSWTYINGPYIGLSQSHGTGSNLGSFKAIVNEGASAVGGTIEVVATANGCSSQPGSYPLVVKPRPKIKPIADIPLCPLPAGAPIGAAGGSFNVNFEVDHFTTDIQYDWTKNIDGGTPDPPVSGNINETFGDRTDGRQVIYYIEVTATGTGNSPAAGCVSKPVSFKMIVNPRPQVTGITPSSQTICSGLTFQNITYNDNAGGISTFEWWDSDNTVTGSPGSGTGSRIIFSNPSDNTSTGSLPETITIQATSMAGCVGPKATVNLTVNPAPVLKKPDNITACSEAPVTPAPFSTTNGLVPDSYTWTISNQSLTDLSSNTGTVTTSMPQFTTYANPSLSNQQTTVRVTGEYAGCQSAPETFTITVRPIPKVNTVAPISVCPGAAINIPPFTTNLTGNDASVVKWASNWKLEDGTTDPELPSSASGSGNITTFSVSPNSTGQKMIGSYSLNATVNTCTGPDTEFTVTIKPTPVIAQEPNRSVCNGQVVPSINFTSTSLGVTYHWSRTGDNIGLANQTASGPLPEFTAQNNTPLMLSKGISTISVYTAAEGCNSEVMKFNITVQPVAQVAPYENIVACAGEVISELSENKKFETNPAPAAGDNTSFEWTANPFDQLRLSPLIPLPAGTKFPDYPQFTDHLPDFVADTSRTNHNPNDLWGSDPKSMTITVIPIFNNCSGNAKNITVTINPLPVTEIKPPTNNCVGENDMVLYEINGGGTAGSKYGWGVENMDPLLLPYAPKIPSHNPDSVHYEAYQYTNVDEVWKGWITVKERNIFGCWAPTEKLYIETIPAPVVVVVPEVVACSGDTIRLSATVNGSAVKPPDIDRIEWFPASSLVPVDVDLLNPRIVPYAIGGVVNTTTISFSAEKGSCRSQPKIITITAYPLPGRPLINDVAYCSNESEWKMTVTGTGNDFKWYRFDSDTIPIGHSYREPELVMNELDNGNLHYTDALPELPGTNAFDQLYDASEQVVFSYRVYQTVTHSTVLGTQLSCKSEPGTANMTIRKTPDKPATVDEAYCEVPGQLSYQLSQTGNNIRWYYPNDATYKGPGNTFWVQTEWWAPNAGDPVAGTHTFYVTDRGANGCESFPAEKRLIIHELPELNFTVKDVLRGVFLTGSDAGGCADFEIEATNNSNDANVDYLWVWGDQTTNANAPIGTSVPHTYVNDYTAIATYVLQLQGTSKTQMNTSDGTYCSSTQTQPLKIYPKVVADFLQSKTVDCAPLEVMFTNTSTGASKYRWYWNSPNPPAYDPLAGDPEPVVSGNEGDPWYGSQGPHQLHRFENTSLTAARDFHVWLQVDNGYCVDNKDVKITVQPSPKVSFTLSPNMVCPPDPVTFTNTSDAGNPAGTKYFWDFGDTNGDTTLVINQPVSHVYENTFSYRIGRDVWLKAENGFGCRDSLAGYVLVNPMVTAAFVGDTEGCSPVDAQFISQSANATSWEWNFGDGSTSGTGQMPSHTYTNPTRNTVQYHTVTLTASNNYGCKDVITQPFTVYPTPYANFTVDQNMGCQPLNVTFTNRSNGNPATNMLYIFDYGDASVDTIRNDINIQPQHEYVNLRGTNERVQPQLTVVNEWMCSSRHSEYITIYPYVKAFFRVDKSAGCAPVTVQFTDGSQGRSTYEWDFGDGVVEGGTIGINDTHLNPTHDFTNSSMYQEKVYTVKLTVTSGNGCNDTHEEQITVYGNPRADFTANPQTDYYPAAPIQIENRIQPPDKNQLKYIWSNAPQGSATETFSLLPDPLPLQLNSWGKYDITQYVYVENSGPEGRCEDSQTLTVTIVAPTPVADFAPVPPACMPYHVQFENLSEYAKEYQWSFGDGATSTAENPLHTYQDAGTYTVTLTATGDNAYPALPKVREITVHPQPRAFFKVSPEFLWVGQRLRAFNQTTHTTTTGQPYDVWYRWDWSDNTPVDTVENPSHIYLKAGTYDITLTTGTYTDPQCIDTYTDSDAVTLETSGDIILPNTFKPYPSGEPSDVVLPGRYNNHLFYPPVVGPTRKYKMSIYHRWGQLLYQTEDPGRGWTGYFKGRLCDEGVYIYKVEGVFETGQSFSKMGDILLLR